MMFGVKVHNGDNMNIDRNAVILAAKESSSLEMLASKFHRENNEEFRDEMENICPGFEKLIELNEVSEAMKEASEIGEDPKVIKALRREMISLIADIGKLGLKTAPSASNDKGSLVEEVVAPVKEPRVDQEAGKTPKKVKAKKEPKVQKVKKDLEEGDFEPIDVSEIVCEVARPMVKGYVPGQSYLGRKLIFVRLQPGLFGDGVVCQDTLKRYTVCKGIINHTDVRLDEPPTTYWAVMDAMSELGEFTKAQAVELAVKRMIEGGSRDNNDRMYSACGIAFDVLKTHQSHPTKMKSGMTHICEEGEKTSSGQKLITIRGRRAEETMEYFIQKKAEMRKALKDGKPLRTICLKDPV